MKRKHETKEQQELSKTHVCPNCENGFYTNALLQKHLNADTCNISEKILNVTSVHLQSGFKPIKD